MNLKHIVLSGCSGGGKSTLLAELERRGFSVVPEPGRRIVEEEQRSEGLAIPWVDLAAFAKRAIDLASEDRRRMVDEASWVFFDRGLVDAAVALEHATGSPARTLLASYDRYHQSVFLTPPWPEIYVTDTERQHDLTEATSEYDRLLTAYRELGYDTVILPKVGVGDRADFILRHLS
ncbi:AAA family ATPase [Devosia sp. 1566]|uniref:AAA family ATPase n=1 Tax=Devosia sp. 1566 TaxID=2499144 RepID=UPI000FD7B450|nr:AAA family ATPase [Devosia sp. 1566]